MVGWYLPLGEILTDVSEFLFHNAGFGEIFG
jgi:hypothetical protein